MWSSKTVTKQKNKKNLKRGFGGGRILLTLKSKQGLWEKAERGGEAKGSMTCCILERTSLFVAVLRFVGRYIDPWLCTGFGFVCTETPTCPRNTPVGLHKEAENMPFTQVVRSSSQITARPPIIGIKSIRGPGESKAKYISDVKY